MVRPGFWTWPRAGPKKALKTWLAQRDQDWRGRVEVVVMDSFTGFKSAAGEEFPRARAALHSYARRVTGCQQARPVPPPHPTSDTQGTKAAKVTSSTGPGATLCTEANLLTNAEARRLETLFADMSTTLRSRPPGASTTA